MVKILTCLYVSFSGLVPFLKTGNMADLEDVGNFDEFIVSLK